MKSYLIFKWYLINAPFSYCRFVRFLTFDECHDAIATLHKRVLGNKAITVEYAAETKDKLEGKKGDLNVEIKLLFLDHLNTLIVWRRYVVNCLLVFY